MLLNHIVSILCALALGAQAADPQIAFTSTPLSVVADQTYNLTWEGGDETSPVTIELRRGDSANLTWVATLTTDASNGSFLWTVSANFPNANDYTLQIFELNNVENINYSARFSLSDGTAVPTAITTQQAVGTGVGTGSTTGTGTALLRNTTFVQPTLTSLPTTCTGLNGICVGNAPTTTGGMVSPSHSVLAPEATASATGGAGRLARNGNCGLIVLSIAIELLML